MFFGGRKEQIIMENGKWKTLCVSNGGGGSRTKRLKNRGLQRETYRQYKLFVIFCLFDV